MKKKWWIILICLVVLAVWVAVRYYGYAYKYSYWYDFDWESGCYKIDCGPKENCQFVHMCPWQPYFREWRIGHKRIFIRNCCDDSVEEGESCWWGGKMRESYDDAYCGKDCCKDSIRGDENCRCLGEVVSSSDECYCIVDDAVFDHIEWETIDTGISLDETTWENEQEIYFPGVPGSGKGCAINENGEEICWYYFN